MRIYCISLTSRIHSCCNASSGVILCTGSQSRHLHKKSRNCKSLVLRALERSFVPGRLFLPLELVIHRGLPLESAKGSCDTVKRSHDSYQITKTIFVISKLRILPTKDYATRSDDVHACTQHAPTGLSGRLSHMCLDLNPCLSNHSSLVSLQGPSDIKREEES